MADYIQAIIIGAWLIAGALIGYKEMRFAVLFAPIGIIYLIAGPFAWLLFRK